MSQAGPLGRPTPRWSTAGHPAPATGTLSIAALPVPSEIVGVGPPLSWSGPRLGSAVRKVERQPEPAKLRLWPASATAPEQLPPPSEASREFWSVAACAKMPPPDPAPPPDASVPVPVPDPPQRNS